MARSIDPQVVQFITDTAKSRTMWGAFLLPLAVTLFPPLAPLIAANPETAAWAAGALMAGLRLVTKTEITPPVAVQPKSTP